VHWALGDRAMASFFRFPALKHSPHVIGYLAQRNIATFSTDIDSFDFRMKTPAQVIESVASKLNKSGKGIVLLHDFQHATADALPDLLDWLKAHDYKIVFAQSRDRLQSIAAYDRLTAKRLNPLPDVHSRPTAAVVRTVTE
jgi:peptidoglycan/xylan/chitin deacetylase (PgdA/CDA1 family)